MEINDANIEEAFAASAHPQRNLEPLNGRHSIKGNIPDGPGCMCLPGGVNCVCCKLPMIPGDSSGAGITGCDPRNFHPDNPCADFVGCAESGRDPYNWF